MRAGKYFCVTVLPAPLLGVLVPGDLAFKGIVIAAVAAAQAAYQLAQAEYAIAQGLEAVALKSRSSAIADTYANQGARAGKVGRVSRVPDPSVGCACGAARAIRAAARVDSQPAAITRQSRGNHAAITRQSRVAARVDSQPAPLAYATCGQLL